MFDLLPTCRMSTSDLNVMLKKIIVGLEDIGFRVIGVITDNNSMNRKSCILFRFSSKAFDRLSRPF